ncbi:hypothetical protein K438DRAFT_1840198 [Mycena galopus ATCC 62051]|nr:hypothetical protein K438DRAFT_1840198 [Mycena galopus ATCC 62051]
MGPTLNYDIRSENLTMNNINDSGFRTGLYLLQKAAAMGALHNSGESYPQPRCHPETRTELLADLYNWAVDPESHYSLRLLHGPAGAGKSAVMQTLCRRLEDAGKLAGSFFFKRGHPTRGQAKALFTTLAYQLALHRDELKGPVSHRIETDPLVLHRGMDIQLRTLILEPCQLLHDGTPLILLVDGLDECDGNNIQKEILCLIGSALGTCSWLRVLVASRPEPHIRETLETWPLCGQSESINIEQAFEDVKTYLRDEFSRIHRTHHMMRHIPSPWPPSQTLDWLVEQSSGYFIYASTVIKFVDNEYSRPTRQLDIIQNPDSHESESPFKTLDQLYLQILEVVPPRYRAVLCDILCMMNSSGPVWMHIKELEQLLGLQLGDALVILRPLHAVLEISPYNISWHDASFLEFLNNPERSLHFYIGSPQQEKRVACLILKGFTYTYEDPQKNRAGFLFRWVASGAQFWMAYITSLKQPSVEFVPLLQQMNLDFLFCTYTNEEHMEFFCLDSSKIPHVPLDLIQCWEDYCFINIYRKFEDDIFSILNGTTERVLVPSYCTIRSLQDRMDGDLQALLGACRWQLALSPQLIQIFQARRLLCPGGHPHFFGLFQIRIILNLSWNDIRQVLCSLRPLATAESDLFYILFSCLPAFCRELDHVYPEAMASRDLARGFIRLMQRIENGGLPMIFWKWLNENGIIEWGRHIRSCTQSDPEVLQALTRFIPPWDVFSEAGFDLKPVEFYDVVQWLKSSFHPQSDLIACWQNHLKKSKARMGVNETDDQLEMRWRDNIGKEASFREPLQPRDEAVIQKWESCLNTLRKPQTSQEKMEGMMRHHRR